MADIPESTKCSASPDHADILETVQNAADDWQAKGYPTALAEVRDMANVGRALMAAIADNAGSPPLKGWHPADCPSEIVSDLLNMLDDATQAAPPAMDREAVERLQEALERADGHESQAAMVKCDDLRAALSALSADAIRQGEGWQPIETAPRDGTVLDLWLEFPAFEGRASFSLRSPDGCWSEKHQDWITRGGFFLGQYAAKPFATHWMRRPDGPATPASHASDGEGA